MASPRTFHLQIPFRRAPGSGPQSPQDQSRQKPCQSRDHILRQKGDGPGSLCQVMKKSGSGRTLITHQDSLLKPDGYLLGSYRIATAPDPNSNRLTSFKSTRFDSPANNVGPWPTSLGCTTSSYSSIKPSSVKSIASFTP